MNLMSIRTFSIILLLAAMFAHDGRAVKFVRDVLPAIGATTTVLVNADTLVKAIKHPKATVKTVVKKVKGK